MSSNRCCAVRDAPEAPVESGVAQSVRKRLSATAGSSAVRLVVDPDGGQQAARGDVAQRVGAQAVARVAADQAGGQLLQRMTDRAGIERAVRQQRVLGVGSVGACHVRDDIDVDTQRRREPAAVGVRRAGRERRPRARSDTPGRGRRCVESPACSSSVLLVGVPMGSSDRPWAV